MLIVALLILSGCQSLVWDPSDRVSSSKGHITDRERVRPATTQPFRDDGGIAIGDDVPRAQDSIVGGTGTFVRRVGRPTVDTTPGDVTLNFDGTDIREVVKVILGDLLGVNYVLDPAVQGSVSLQTGRPLRRDLLIPTLETLLRMNNAALVDNAGTFEIVPLNNAVSGRIVPQLGESARALPEGYSVQVVPLRYIGAERDEPHPRALGTGRQHRPRRRPAQPGRPCRQQSGDEQPARHHPDLRRRLDGRTVGRILQSGVCQGGRRCRTARDICWPTRAAIR